MGLLSGPYAINRLVVPTFLAPLTDRSGVPLGAVLVQSNDHHNPAFLTVGYVSRQTPFGQGIYHGVPKRDLRRADPEEIRAALQRDHAHGASFRPFNTDAADATFHTIMSTGLSNWTTDGASAARPPIQPYSRQDFQDAAARSSQAYAAVMARWDEITQEQIKRILASL
jgi:hypothetical protein